MMEFRVARKGKTEKLTKYSVQSASIQDLDQTCTDETFLAYSYSYFLAMMYFVLRHTLWQR